MKKIICFLLAFFWLSFFFQMSAQYNFQIKVSNHEVIESMVLNTDSTIQSLVESKTLSAEISKYKIVEYKNAYPAFEDPRLQNIYLFKVTKPGLAEELLKEFPDKFLEYWVVDEPVLLYEPNDFAGDPYIHTQNDILLIRGKHAWDISKGSSSIKVGINDTYIETTHDDLEDKINTVIDNGNPYSANAYHGVCVSFCAAGDTDNDNGLASIGFNTMINFEAGPEISALKRLADAGSKIVNASWRSCIYNDNDQIAIDEIHDMGVIIVAGAGNGPRGTSCGPDGHSYCYPASYNHVISVSSVGHEREYGYIDPVYGAVGWKDVHEDSANNALTCHTHNDSVDICAPGHHVHTATLNNSYTAAWGTSFASPIIAGVCALILDVNPDLTPDEVEDILKSTADNIYDIPENMEYEGLLGAGRVNAYAALNAARETNKSYSSVPYFTGFETGIDEYWIMKESTKYGRSVLNTDQGPKTGQQHLTMDVSEDGNYNTNQALLHLNLSGESDVALSFWWKETGDESHTTDGIYLSDNGGSTFTKVYNLTNGSSTYQNVILDISDEIASHSLSHTGSFVVKFQQYDNFSMTTDGMAFDDINVCAKPSKPSWISAPYEHCIFDWEEYICATVSDAVSYEWATDDVGLMLSQDGTNKVDVKAIDEDYYTLKVRAKNICNQYSDWKTKSIFIENCGGQLKMAGDDPFVVYPNPADNEIIIEANKSAEIEMSEEPTEYQISIVDQVGIVLHSKTYAELPVIINSVNFKDGLYTVTIRFGESQYSYDIVIKH